MTIIERLRVLSHSSSLSNDECELVYETIRRFEEASYCLESARRLRDCEDAGALAQESAARKLLACM